MPEKGKVIRIGTTYVADPALGGVIVTDEPIWSSNTGRSTTGKMIGDIVDWKTTIEITWPPLSFSETAQIRNAIKNAGEFFDLTYYDMSASTPQTKTVYCGNIPRTLYSLEAHHRMHQGITIKFIEQ